MQNEKFTNIQGSNYSVSNIGNIKNNKSKQILKSGDNGKGYLFCFLWKYNKSKRFYVHRLVAQTFIPNPDNKPCVNHIDGNKENNNVNNLEWCTHSENMKHAYKINLRENLMKYGENSIRHKLTENEVLIIHGLYLGGISSIKIGQIFDMHNSSILSIINGRNWNIF